MAQAELVGLYRKLRSSLALLTQGIAVKHLLNNIRWWQSKICLS